MVWLVAAAVLVGALANALAWAYPWRVGRRIIAGSAARTAAVPDGPWEAQLSRELSAATSEAERVAVVNEQLSDLQHDLELPSSWPHAAVWLSACGQLMALTVGFVIGLRSELLAVLPVACAAVLGCLWARRVGRCLAARQRRRADAVVDALVGELAGRSVAMPVRRRCRGAQC